MLYPLPVGRIVAIGLVLLKRLGAIRCIFVVDLLLLGVEAVVVPLGDALLLQRWLLGGLCQGVLLEVGLAIVKLANLGGDPLERNLLGSDLPLGHFRLQLSDVEVVRDSL